MAKSNKNMDKAKEKAMEGKKKVGGFFVEF